jgi:outer membrane receptor protein involved in Fe transport
MNPANGISAQLALSYTGDRLYTVSRYINNDFWQKGFWQLDFSCEKRFKRGFSAFAKAQNLLNTKVIVYIKNTNPANAQKPYHSADDKTTLVRSEYSKPVYLAGVRYKF